MRLPVNITPPVAVTENRYQIRQPDAISATRAVAPHASFRQIFHHQAKQMGLTPEHDEMVEEASQETVGYAVHYAVVEQHTAEEHHLHQERRMSNRRVANEPVLLDTRSGHDRRMASHHEGEAGSGIDEVV